MHERPNACGGSPESGYDAEEELPFTRLLGHLPCYLFYYPRSLPRQHSLRLFHKLVEETGDVEEPEECDEKDDECKEREEHLEGYCCRIGHHVVFDESLDRVDQVFMQLAKPEPTLSHCCHNAPPLPLYIMPSKVLSFRERPMPEARTARFCRLTVSLLVSTFEF